MTDYIYNDTEVDILIIAEGTFPFVRGGVAAWIGDLIQNLPEFNFGVVFLGAYEGLYEKPVYPLPANLKHLQIIYLFDRNLENPKETKNEVSAQTFQAIVDIHETFKQSHGCPHALTSALPDIGLMLDANKGCDYFHFLHDERIWDFICEQYSKHATDPSFINYFWNIRNMHTPLWFLEQGLHTIPKTKIVHTISTGYAGLFASMVQQRFNYPMILSEHGLYTKERNIELLQTTMFTMPDKLLTDNKSFSYQHTLWLKFFDSLSRTSYFYASLIISLYSSAQEQQILAGAPADKTMVIANGVDIPRFSALRRSPEQPIPKIVCFVGRFVRIKDIKTFIRAISIMTQLDNNLVAWIKMVGEPDKEYMEECVDYINLLQLNDKIKFIDEGDMFDILPQIGLLILSSISEGMPLVLLESLAAGIPVIATDVGSCREIIEGKEGIDKDKGACGAIVSIANAQKLAEESVRFLNDSELWHHASTVGIERVEQFYNQKGMIAQYKELYLRALK